MRGKTWKKLLAGYLAAVCLPLGSVTALADELSGGDGARAGNPVQAVVSGNTVTVGNEYVSREFSIAGGKLETAKITNKRTGGGGAVFAPAEGSEEFKIRVTKKEHPKIDKSGWTAVADSYQDERVGAGIDGNAGALIDNDTSTIWHTKYDENGTNGTGPTNLPYNVIFNLGKSTAFQCFSFTPRSNGSQLLGIPKDYTLYYSTSADETLAVNDASWQELKSGQFSTAEAVASRRTVYVNLDQACAATHLKLKITGSYGGDYVNGAEFDLHAEKKPETDPPDTEREFASSDLRLSGAPGIEDTEAEINGARKTGKKVTFSFEPYTFQGVTYTVNEVIVMYEGDHFMRKYMEISVPDAQKADAVIDYIDLESMVTSESDATWTIPTDARSHTEIGAFKENLGQPVYIQGMFFGSEFPVTDNEIVDGTGYMRYYSGKSFARMEEDHQLTADGKYVTWQTVAGAARSAENEVIQADFFEYIKSIATPSEFRIQYNSWFDNMMRIDDDNILESFIEIDRELNKAGVRPLDSYVVDDGWNNYNDTDIVDSVRSGTALNESGFWEFNTKFPQGLTPSSELVKKFGSNFGVWIGPRGGYNFQGSLASILTKSGKGSGAGGSVDVADRVYVQNFEKMAVDWMKEYDVNYWKWDGFSNEGQYNAFQAEDGVPGYANRHMTGGFQHMYHVTDLWEAWIDLMEHVRECEKQEEINKLWISLTCYVNPSPWYLQWANSVWIQCTLDQGNAGPSSSHMDRQLTYREAVYYDFLKNHQFQFPLSNIYNHDPVYGTEGTDMNINTATDEQFQNYLYMQSTRGTAFWELYFSDSIMTEGKYEVTAEFLEWAEENHHMLKNAKMFGASPDAGSGLNGGDGSGQNAYGFSCFDGTDGLISFRNAANAQKSVTITFDRTIGVPEDAGTLKYHMEHSHNLTEGTPTTGELVYGQEYTITLKPDEVRILRVSKDGDTKAPKIVRAYSDGEGAAVVRFNEKVKGGTFKINGKAAQAALGADDVTFHLTATDDLDGADIMTVTAEGVTDLAGNALTDNERSFRYYADGAVASKQRHTVNREESLAKERDSLTGTNGFSVKAEIATGSSGQVVRQGEEYGLGINEDGTAYFVLNGLTVSSKKVVNDGFTHKIAGVKENNGMMKLYVDGELEGSAYKAENKCYDVQAADIVLGNTDFYGSVKADVLDVAQGYDVMKEESGSGDDVVEPVPKVNLAEGKTVTAKWTGDGSDAAKGIDCPMNKAVDGIKDDTNSYGEFGTDARKESSYMQVDLGGVESISKINLYRYWLDNRTYAATVVALSENDDFSNPTVIYNSDADNVHGLGAGTDQAYAETSEGRTFELDEPCDARYIRVYMYGTTTGNTNHVVELEAFREPDTPSEETDADYTAVNQAMELAGFLLEDYKGHSDWYSNPQADFDALDAARAAVVEGKKADEQALVDKMAADIFAAASKIKKTVKRELWDALDKAELIAPEEFYTPESIAKYEADVEEARKIFENASASEKQIQDAIAKVNDAQKKLVTLLAVAETELAFAIESAEAVENDPSNTPESWQAFQDAIKAAKNLQMRPSTAKKAEDFTTALKAIEEARKGIKEPNAVTGVTVSSAGGKTELAEGATLLLTATVATVGQVDDKTVTWSVSGGSQNIASVDENGLVTGKAAGSVTVTARANRDKTKFGSITLTVTAKKTDGKDPVQAAKNDLSSSVAAAGRYTDASKYTAASWNALQKAIREARNVINSPNSAKSQIDAAKAALEKAIRGLKPASANTVKIEQGKVYINNQYSYKVTSLAKQTVEVTGVSNASIGSIVIGDTVTLDDKKSYKITSIGNQAFRNKKKATGVTIGKNVTKIGKEAFSGCVKVRTIKINSAALAQIDTKAFANCKKLKTITIKSKKLKTVKKNAFKGIAKNAKIKVPKTMFKKYKKRLANKGQAKSVKITK